MLSPVDPQVLLWPESRQCGLAGEPARPLHMVTSLCWPPGSGLRAEDALRRGSCSVRRGRLQGLRSDMRGGEGLGPAGAWGPMAPASAPNVLVGENLREGPEALLW